MKQVEREVEREKLNLSHLSIRSVEKEKLTDLERECERKGLVNRINSTN